MWRMIRKEKRYSEEAAAENSIETDALRLQDVREIHGRYACLWMGKEDIRRTECFYK